MSKIIRTTIWCILILIPVMEMAAQEFSPVTPPIYNVTGVMYQGGNTGWIREQMGFRILFSD